MNHDPRHPSSSAATLPHRSQTAQWALAILIIAYCGFFGWLAVMRHQTFGSSAMDMGYTDQVVWNTLHGRLFQFTTLENALIDLPLTQFRRTDILLAYHVELWLLPLSLLYLIWSNPLMLLLLQVLGIALGAWPTYLLARDHLQSAWAGLAFAAAYLMAPATQGATLADFHTTSLMLSLLVFVLYAAHHKRWRTYLITSVICLLAKEDISLIVFMMGGWLFLFRRERRVGLISMTLGTGWFLLCTRVILPYYNGLGGSPFVQRLAIFGPTLRESVNNFVSDPGRLWRWLLQPDILVYGRGLLASGGYLSLFSPIILSIAAPAVGINVFSTWSWTYSGGEHYSATILPIVIVSAIYGLGTLAGLASRWRRLQRQNVVLALSLIMLGVSGTQYVQQGIWPMAARFHVPRVTEHHRIGQSLIAMIPADASVSAQSNLYPHISQREQAYFYPALNDAEYVFLDVSGASYPLTAKGLGLGAKQLMRSGDYGLVAAQDGYLLLQQGATPNLNLEFPDAFYAFTRGDERDIAHPTQVHFSDALELVGWEVGHLNVVQSHSLPITITTWWRPLRQLPMDYQFVLFFTREDGAIVFAFDQPTAATLWRPPYYWEPGELIRLETPVLTAGGLEDVLVAVVKPGKDVWQTDGRLPVDRGAPAENVLDQGTLYRAIHLP